MEPSPVSRKIRVLVADTSRIHTQLLTNELQQDPDLVVVSWDSNSSSLISAIAAQKVDILAISSGLGGRSTAQLSIVSDVHSLYPKTKIVVLLDSQDAQLVIDAFRAGARGVFSRESSIEMFRKCIRSVNRGEVWADNREVLLAVNALASAPVIRTKDYPGLKLLSKREFEVVQCVVQGMTNREIAVRLRLSQHTVKNYLFRVFDKLGVSSRVELLFMTLGRDHDVERRSQEPLSNDVLRQMFTSGPHDSGTVAFLEKAAEEGAAAAQLSLAQALAARGGADELSEAYMWLSIAADQALQARVQLAKRLTAQQIGEAERKANMQSTRIKQTVSPLFAIGLPATEADTHQAGQPIPDTREETAPATVASETAKPADKKSVARSHVPAVPVLNFGSA